MNVLDKIENLIKYINDNAPDDIKSDPSIQSDPSKESNQDQPKATDYHTFDYANTYKRGDNFKFENNLSSSFVWMANAMEDFVISQILSIPDKKNKFVLDIACGTGQYCHRMQQLGFGEIHGIDISEQSINSAKNLCKNAKNISFQVMNALDLLNDERYHNKYDVVNASWLYMHARNEKELDIFTKATLKCLKNGGIFTGMDWNTNMVGSEQEEWEQFGVCLFTDKYAKYKPKDGQFLYTLFGIQGGPRIAVNKSIKDVDEMDEKVRDKMDKIDFGTALNGFFYKQQTITKYLQQNEFKNIEFIDPKRWDFVYDSSVSTLNDEDRNIFSEYIKMGNLQMCGFKAFKL